MPSKAGWLRTCGTPAAGANAAAWLPAAQGFDLPGCQSLISAECWIALKKISVFPQLHDALFLKGSPVKHFFKTIWGFFGGVFKIWLERGGGKEKPPVTIPAISQQHVWGPALICSSKQSLQLIQMKKTICEDSFCNKTFCAADPGRKALGRPVDAGCAKNISLCCHLVRVCHPVILASAGTASFCLIIAAESHDKA